MAATLQSCRLIPQAPAPFAVSVAVAARPLPSTSAFVPPGCRRERHHWPSLNQKRHVQPGAIRPCLVVRAGKHNCGGGALPVWLKPGELPDRHYFVEERKRVMDPYNDIVHIDHGCLYIEATKMSGQLCLLSNQALTMASQIMIFVDAADAAHGRTVSRNTATSFVSALGGLASVSHILLDAALEALNQTHPRESLAEYAFNCDVEAMRCEFGRQMDGIENAVRKASAAETWCKVVMPGIMQATRTTGSFVRLMVARRERALGKANSKVVAV